MRLIINFEFIRRANLRPRFLPDSGKKNLIGVCQVSRARLV
jgi:hypothetical protein